MQAKPLSSSSSSSSNDAAPSPPSIGMGMGLNSGAKDNGRKARKKLPTPKEMVAHYESKGMQTQEASLKVIDDLQNLLLRVVNTNNNTTNINTRLLTLESKLDSKPGYPQTLAIGILSGAVIRVFPQVAASVAHVWNSVRHASTTSSST